MAYMAPHGFEDDPDKVGFCLGCGLVETRHDEIYGKEWEQMGGTMRFVYLWKTNFNRGDHFADVQIAVEPHSSETVDEFARRILGAKELGDVLEIRLIADASKL
jgi:hypothetical protein